MGKRIVPEGSGEAQIRRAFMRLNTEVVDKFVDWRDSAATTTDEDLRTTGDIYCDTLHIMPWSLHIGNAHVFEQDGKLYVRFGYGRLFEIMLRPAPEGEQYYE